MPHQVRTGRFVGVPRSWRGCASCWRVPLGGEDGLPFAPITEALRGLAADLDPAELEAVAGPARAGIGRLLPDLAWRPEAAGTAVADAGQGRLFELLLGVVERLAVRSPLLWVMEDLHWADRSTRDLVAFLAAYLRTAPVLMGLTFRSDELHRPHPLRGLLGELARNRRACEDLNLGDLFLIRSHDEVHRCNSSP